mmetsp:Transcript_12839/g.51628  ORF Transcript_12839/g.51628 Transcript_12839/m.51628 type:complete len:318 (+) Transcript_12839:937-1890(+)
MVLATRSIISEYIVDPPVSTRLAPAVLGLGLRLGLDEELILLGVPLARAGQVVLGRASVERGHLGRFLLDLLLRLGERKGEGQALDDEVRPLAPLLPRHLLAVGRLPEVGAPSRQPAHGQHQVLAEPAHVLRLRSLPGELRVGKVLSLRASRGFIRRSPLRGEGSLPSERSLVIRRALGLVQVVSFLPVLPHRLSFNLQVLETRGDPGFLPRHRGERVEEVILTLLRLKRGAGSLLVHEELVPASLPLLPRVPFFGSLRADLVHVPVAEVLHYLTAGQRVLHRVEVLHRVNPGEGLDFTHGELRAGLHHVLTQHLDP